MRYLGLLVLILILLSGCAGQDRIVLLPSPDNQAGAVIVKTSRGQTLLDKPYGAVDVGQDGQIDVKTLQRPEVEQQFSAALAAQPPRPVSFTLYFLEGKDELTPESKQAMESIRTELAKRPAPEITVIGHTDRVGTIPQNDMLSLMRAEAVRTILTQAGIVGTYIEVAGRGERELLVPTDDGIAEPRNRRVEISVR